MKRYRLFIKESLATDIADFNTGKDFVDALKHGVPVEHSTLKTGFPLSDQDMKAVNINIAQHDIREIKPEHLPDTNPFRHHMERTGHRIFVSFGPNEDKEKDTSRFGIVIHRNRPGYPPGSLIVMNNDKVRDNVVRHALISHEVQHILSAAKGRGTSRNIRSKNKLPVQQPYYTQRDEHNAHTHGIFAALQHQNYRNKLKQDLQSHFGTKDLSSINKQRLVSKATDHAIYHAGTMQPMPSFRRALLSPTSVADKAGQKRTAKGRNRTYHRVSRWIEHNVYNDLIS